MVKNKGFTLIELLVVLLIIGILASIMTPLYLRHTRRARASEAIATMALIRQALRDENINTGLYNDILQGDLKNTFDNGTAPGADIDLGVVQYFSNDAYSVDATSPTPTGASSKFTDPNVVDFLITVQGDQSDQCVGSGDTQCAVKRDQIVSYELEMDNTGRSYISYDNGTTWRAY
jgi:general secretion pathway protein G